jgi:hypothetical protein
MFSDDRRARKVVYSPNGVESNEIKGDEWDKMICELLADGWEPYALEITPYIEHQPGTCQLCFRRGIA